MGCECNLSGLDHEADKCRKKARYKVERPLSPDDTSVVLNVCTDCILTRDTELVIAEDAEMRS
jgi:hypothetical protein